MFCNVRRAQIWWSSHSQKQWYLHFQIQKLSIWERHASKENMWLREPYIKLFPNEKSMVIKCDNISAINLCSYKAFHPRTKHIDIKHYFIQKKFYDGIIKLDYIPTKEMLISWRRVNLLTNIDFLLEALTLNPVKSRTTNMRNNVSSNFLTYLLRVNIQ